MTFDLLSFPSGAALDPASGVLVWRPTREQADTTNRVVVTVTDDGVPSLSATQSFNVVVNPLEPVSIERLSVNQDEITMSVNGNAGLDYTLQASENLESWMDLFSTNATVVPFTWTVPNAGVFTNRFFRILLGP
jgi:hypothetical protein